MALPANIQADLDAISAAVTQLQTDQAAVAPLQAAVASAQTALSSAQTAAAAGTAAVSTDTTTVNTAIAKLQADVAALTAAPAHLAAHSLGAGLGSVNWGKLITTLEALLEALKGSGVLPG